MQRVLVVGGRGMLGSQVYRYLSSQPDIEVVATSRRGGGGMHALDVLDGREGIERHLMRGVVDLVVNCAGVLRGDICRSDSASMRQSLTVNGVWPHVLAEAAERLPSTKVLHMSTDAVFSGERTGGYCEEDRPDSTDVYGAMKTLGEPQSDAAITVRCSIIGPDGARRRGLFEWVRSRAEGSVVDGYQDHIWSGVTTMQFAELCAEIVRENSFSALRNLSHVFHFSPNPPMSKADLVTELSGVLGKDLQVCYRPAPSGPMRLELRTQFPQLTGLVRLGRSWECLLRDLM